MESGEAAKQTDALLNALQNFPDLGMVFTMPGADKEYKIIWKKIKAFAKKNPNAKTFSTLGSHIYLSVMKEVDAVVGNSSSGLLEAPALKKPVLNIGNRQRGRVRAGCVLDCPNLILPIRRGIRHVLGQLFREKSRYGKNPYGNGKTTLRIVKILQRHRQKELHSKAFHDCFP